MLDKTKLFIENNIKLLDKDLAEFLELASLSYHNVPISDLIDTLKQADIENIYEAQIQVLINRLHIEFRYLFDGNFAPAIVEVESWVKAHDGFNIGLTNEEIIDHITTNAEEYENDVQISLDTDYNRWIIMEAW